MAKATINYTTGNQYYDQASQMGKPGYDSAVADLTNAFNNNMTQLGNSANGINNMFDNSVNQAMLNTRRSQNNLSNTMLGRGMGNSSIVTSGLAEQDVIGNRTLNDIEMQRNAKLSDLEWQKILAQQGFDTSKNAMNRDYEKGIVNLAMQLEDRDREEAYRQAQLQLEKDRLAMERENARRAASGGGMDMSWLTDLYKSLMPAPPPTAEERRNYTTSGRYDGFENSNMFKNGADRSNAISPKKTTSKSEKKKNKENFQSLGNKPGGMYGY